MLQIRIEQARRGCIPPSLGKCLDLHDPDRLIQRDGNHIADLDAVAGRFLPLAIDPNPATLDQRDGTGPGFHHPHMPQPFIETLSVQMGTLFSVSERPGSWFETAQARLLTMRDGAQRRTTHCP